MAIGMEEEAINANNAFSHSSNSEGERRQFCIQP